MNNILVALFIFYIFSSKYGINILTLMVLIIAKLVNT